MILNLPETLKHLKIYKEHNNEKREGYVNCNKCNSRGFELYTPTLKLARVCSKCNGNREIPWTKTIINNNDFCYINSHLSVDLVRKNIESTADYLQTLCTPLGFEVQINIVPWTLRRF